jgi:molybdate-binding protein
VLFDAELAKQGVDSQALHRRATVFSSHCDVVCAVARGAADVGLASAAWAQRAGLSFASLGTEPYGLLLRASVLGDPRIARLCEAAQSSAFRHDTESCAGYDTKHAGTVRFLSAPSAP